MCGPGIIGFDRHHYVYDSGREVDICIIGFSPRAQALTLYLPRGFLEYPALAGKLGRHKTSKACLDMNTLDDVDLDVLEESVSRS